MKTQTKPSLNFKGSSPNGRKAEIRKSENPYETGFSVFTWHDSGNGVILWRENHEIEWSEAFRIASEWLNKGA